jgi:hypothetical protein
MTSRWSRLWAGTGLLFAAAYILVLAVSGSNPDDASSAHSITSWYASSSNRARELTVFFIALAGAAAFLWFVAHLRSLVLEARADGRAANLVLASGACFAALFALMGALFSVVAFVKIDAGHKFVLDPNTFWLVNALGDLTFISAYVLVAPLPLTVGAVAWKTGILPRWLAAFSFVAGVGAIASFVWFPTFLVVLWIGVLSGYLAFRPAGARTRVVPAAAAA